MFKDEKGKLRNIVNINKDAVEFYDAAEDQAERPEIKSVFKNMKDAHSIVVRNVHDYISKLDNEVEPAEQTVIGELNQFWGELMTKISTDVDETLVKHLEEAEDRCLHSIQAVIADKDVSAGTRTMLQNEFSTLRNSHDYMKSLKDTMKKAA